MTDDPTSMSVRSCRPEVLTTEIDDIIRAYEGTFGSAPSVVARAPGRVNLIGEHTDYNEGFVLPFAIERAVLVAAGSGEKGTLTVRSVAMNQTVTFPCSISKPAGDKPWQNYVRGVVAALRRRGTAIDGVDLCIGGDLPSGAGLASSAALCVATTLALADLVKAELAPLDVVDVTQEAEREFAGTPCGIMDPYVSLFGQAGKALLLDCRSTTHEYLPLELVGAELLSVPSGVKHDLASSAYELRVRECRDAVAALRSLDPAVRSLRDVTEEMLQNAGPRLGRVEGKRARHVVTENLRVVRAAAALQAGHMQDLGNLLNATHESLRDDYEVSCPEIEALMAVLQIHEDVLGARMMGGGFGGTVLALIREGSVERVKAALEDHVQLPAGWDADAQVLCPSNGAWCRRL